MSAGGMSIMAVLAVYGLYEIVRAAARRLLRKCVRAEEDVVIFVRGGENIEGTVRTLAIKNPGVRIVIADDLKSVRDRFAADKLAGEGICTGHIEREK